MGRFLLAVVFAISQTVVPAPRQSPEKPARASDKPSRESNTQQQQHAATPTARQNTNQPEARKRATSEPHQNEARKTVIIREPAPVPKKDWWDWAYVIATWVLVLIGIGGTLVASGTLSAINKQVAAMIHGERAWVMEDFVMSRKLDGGALERGKVYKQESRDGKIYIGLDVLICLWNDGGVPAWVMSLDAWVIP